MGCRGVAKGDREYLKLPVSGLVTSVESGAQVETSLVHIVKARPNSWEEVLGDILRSGGIGNRLEREVRAWRRLSVMGSHARSDGEACAVHVLMARHAQTVL